MSEPTTNQFSMSREELKQQLDMAFSCRLKMLANDISHDHDWQQVEKAAVEAHWVIRSILSSTNKGPEVDEACVCDDYKWLMGELTREAQFLYVHGLTIENRGPFKFCPYCGKLVRKEK